MKEYSQTQIRWSKSEKITLAAIIFLVLLSGYSYRERFQVFDENENILSMGVSDYKPFYYSALPDLSRRTTSSSDK